MRELLALGVVIFFSAYGYLMFEIFKDAFAPIPHLEPRPIKIGQWRIEAYTDEAIARRERNRFLAQLDKSIFEAQVLMGNAVIAVQHGRTQLKNFDYANLRKGTNNLKRHSWPKKTTIVMKLTTPELNSPLLLIS